MVKLAEDVALDNRMPGYNQILVKIKLSMCLV